MKLMDVASEQILSDDDVIRIAVSILQHRFGLKRTSLNSPAAVRDYLSLTITEKQHEVFCVAFLDAQNRVIAFEEMFRGTLTQTSVYPREVVKRALHHNAAAVILAHNGVTRCADLAEAMEAA